MGEVTDERVDLAEREGRRRVPLEVAPDEAVVGDLELQSRRASVLDRGGAVLLDQPEDAQDPAHPRLSVPAVDDLAEGADVGPRARGLREQRQRGGWGARRPILARIAWCPGGCRRCSRSSAPVVGWSRRTWTPSHWTARSRPSQPGGGA